MSVLAKCHVLAYYATANFTSRARFVHQQCDASSHYPLQNDKSDHRPMGLYVTELFGPCDRFRLFSSICTHDQDTQFPVDEFIAEVDTDEHSYKLVVRELYELRSESP